MNAAAAAKSPQSCPTLCNAIDSSSQGSSIPGTLQARTLEWIAISFSNVWKWKVKVKSLSCGWASVTPWTAAFQALPSMGFSGQEYWSRVPLPSPSVSYRRGNISHTQWTVKESVPLWGFRALGVSLPVSQGPPVPNYCFHRSEPILLLSVDPDIRPFATILVFCCSFLVRNGDEKNLFHMKKMIA